MDMSIPGAFCFGAVIGWVTYRTLRRKEGAALLSDISAVISALGGAAIMAIYNTSELFGIYCIGLFVGFFLYLIVSLNLKDENVGKWMGN